ncbi:hypothetical protein THAOC_04719 [Thalassiosira oceanica]|uniref:Uncharacterized protein n=1 Tax=Thalassiosira oceanica TaxID=159749 RepID=K0TIN6_THAOC|nr:hypothetical protein THAOC_04719 [Thalassiosira oceanica]|eukprot:EJK73646.1 hypothetical protein THAOC_04719 [Thalassiosira oceanica]
MNRPRPFVKATSAAYSRSHDRARARLLLAVRLGLLLLRGTFSRGRLLKPGILVLAPLTILRAPPPQQPARRTRRSDRKRVPPRFLVSRRAAVRSPSQTHRALPARRTHRRGPLCLGLGIAPGRDASPTEHTYDGGISEPRHSSRVAAFCWSNGQRHAGIRSPGFPCAVPRRSAASATLGLLSLAPGQDGESARVFPKGAPTWSRTQGTLSGGRLAAPSRRAVLERCPLSCRAGDHLCRGGRPLNALRDPPRTLRSTHVDAGPVFALESRELLLVCTTSSESPQCSPRWASPRKSLLAPLSKSLAAADHARHNPRLTLTSTCSVLLLAVFISTLTALTFGDFGAQKSLTSHYANEKARRADGERSRQSQSSQAQEERTDVSPSPRQPMSAEYARKRQRGGGDGLAAAINPAKTSATSSVDLESMLKQALARIDSLERQHEEMKTSVGREAKAMRGNIRRLKEKNKAIQALAERQTNALRDDIEAVKSENMALKWSLNRLTCKVQEGWEYPVAIQPDEYWQDKGYNDVAIEYLKEGFFKEVKIAVSKLEHGVCDHVALSYARNHDEGLMPHWNALFQSFDHINPYGEGVRLCLQHIELNEAIMRQICHHIRHRNISQISFSNNGFTNMRGAIIEMENALQSPKLKSLDWYRNPIGSMEDMTLFTRVLAQSNSVEELTFRWNSNENTQALLSGVDFSGYKVLNLGGNNLQTNGRTDISDLIAANPPLEELYLYRNRLNDDDAVLIAQSLGGNTNLRRLYVEDNNIQERGMRALYEAVNDTSTLNALSDSNHSCMVEGLSDDFNLDLINWDHVSNGLRRNRMIKIHKLMVERYIGGGNVPHLNTEVSGGDTVLLAPFVMESVVRRNDAFPKKYKGFECSLGLLYELVKDWKMAELFSFR